VEPLEALGRIVYLLDRAHAPAYRVKAFVTAAQVVAGHDRDEIATLARTGRIRELEHIGEKTGQVIEEAVAGGVPSYLDKLEQETALPVTAEGAALRALLKGDCHSHSTWSDGGAPIATMAATARALGHEYLVVTDHSPRLSIARGLTADRLEAQLDEIDALNERMAPFRVLTGIEVDINDDGSLDQAPELLDRLDLVVASVHSELKMPEKDMTRRMVAAVANPRTDILGHCTGRMRPREGSRRKGRGESAFDAEVVFAACARFDVAVEVNCRPERLDPPRRLLDLAAEWGCRFSIDTDAHAPGQLEWQVFGCDRVAAAGIEPDRIVNTWDANDLVSWAASHRDGGDL
jgi:putative hydrolase